jgi:hypothetical protein
MINYTITVGYETENLDSDGNPKMKKSRYLVEASSVEEAMLVIAKYRSEDSRGSEVLTITKATYEDVISSTLTPKYYGQ